MRVKTSCQSNYYETIKSRSLVEVWSCRSYCPILSLCVHKLATQKGDNLRKSRITTAFYLKIVSSYLQLIIVGRLLHTTIHTTSCLLYWDL